MNDRMAELFGQAGISDSINEEFGIEYLAELIVRDCCQINHDFLGSWRDADEVNAIIKEKFELE